jgi:hypothetical protein
MKEKMDDEYKEGDFIKKSFNIYFNFTSALCVLFENIVNFNQCY